MGIGEVLIILLIMLVIFGPGQLGKVGRGLGEGISNFRKGMKGGDGKTPPDGNKNG